ncbi:MAG: DUF4147 domain-containing protein [Gemmatimonadaceae bacterium]|nr:DUF4147 domain-containing protein [Gemmatimonadaceae bacterium]
MPVTSDPRTLLERLYRGAVRAARPDVALRAALDRASRPVHQRVHCLAIGKAAPAMARATLEWRAASALHGVVGGVCVAAVAPHEPATLAPLELHVGDHPVPAAASLAAAARLGHYIETQVHGGDHVIVCLSGGTSSLIAAPLPGLAPDDITALGHALLHAGLPIDAINRVRRRVHRWGGGRLATAIGARAASASTYLVSDVLGDTLPSIGSGPCTADPVPRHEVLALLERISGAPARVRAWVVADRDDARMPASDDPRARHVTQEIIASSGTLAGAAQGEATRVGLHVDMSVARITGDAHEAGRGFATALLAARERRERRGTRAAPLLRVAVGEPVVHVTDCCAWRWASRWCTSPIRRVRSVVACRPSRWRRPSCCTTPATRRRGCTCSAPGATGATGPPMPPARSSIGTRGGASARRGMRPSARSRSSAATWRSTRWMRPSGRSIRGPT